MTDLVAIAARHARIQSDRGADSDWCGEDGRYWPCDTGQALDELAALRSQRDLLAAAVERIRKADHTAFVTYHADRCPERATNVHLWYAEKAAAFTELRAAIKEGSAIALARSIAEPEAQ